jgi:hypothetical protein
MTWVFQAFRGHIITTKQDKGMYESDLIEGLQTQIGACHTRFSKENQVHTYMHARIKFHAYGDIKVNAETVSRKKKKDC